MLTIKLSSIKIINWDLDFEGNIFQMHQLYKDILQTDDWWHFFREGHYTLLRCQTDYVAEVQKYLEEVLGFNEGDIDVTTPWVDNIETTRRHQTEFTHVFHAFAVLSMKVLEDDNNVAFDAIFDRIIHCFLNMARRVDIVDDILPFIPGKSPGNILHAKTLWESMKICHNALMRSYTIGRLSATNDVQEIIRRKEFVDENKR